MMKKAVAALLLLVSSLALASNPFKYGGYLDGDSDYGVKIFYWFFPAQNPDAPLILWLQGGPGCTGAMAALAENGPYTVDDHLKLVENPGAWTQKYHMLYVDSPIGTGFSYSEKPMSDDVFRASIPENLFLALGDFRNKFKSFADNDFYIFGESYAGKYIPQLSHYILQQKDTQIPLKGIGIGDGFSDPLSQSQSYADFGYQFGLLNANQRSAMLLQQANVRKLIEGQKWMEALAEHTNVTYELLAFSGWPDPSDVRKYGFSSLNFTGVIDFMNLVSTRQALNVGNRSYSEICNSDVGQRMSIEQMQSVKPLFADILSSIRVLEFNGNFDPTVPPAACEEFLLSIDWDGLDGYKSAKRQVWRYNGETAGYVQAFKALTHVTVVQAGHMATEDQPMRVFDMVDRFIEKRGWQ